MHPAQGGGRKEVLDVEQHYEVLFGVQRGMVQRGVPPPETFRRWVYRELLKNMAEQRTLSFLQMAIGDRQCPETTTPLWHPDLPIGSRKCGEHLLRETRAVLQLFS